VTSFCQFCIPLPVKFQHQASSPFIRKTNARESGNLSRRYAKQNYFQGEQEFVTAKCDLGDLLLEPGNTRAERPAGDGKATTILRS
jgi:hypothetical protein